MELIILNTLVAQKAAVPGSLSFGRIAKPLRGGGGAAPAASTSPISLAGAGASPSNPLARLQNEDGYVQMNRLHG